MREIPRYNYNGLLTYLAGGRNKDNRPTNKASLRVLRINGEPVVRMYGANIATFHSDGRITLGGGGWEDSVTTRANIREVTGASIFTIESRKRRAIVQRTRVSSAGMLHGVPYKDGCVVERGNVVWHPDMAEQKISDIRDLVEDVKVVSRYKAEPYYKARKELLARIRPLLYFIDERMLEGVRRPWNLTEWLEGVLTRPLADSELLQVAIQLIDLGAPDRSEYWRRKHVFNPDNVGEYARRGVAKCAGVSSWDYLTRIGALDTVKVRCMEV